MRVQRQVRSAALVLAAWGLLSGCIPTALTPATPETTRGGKIALLPNQSGLGAIAVRVIDQRKGFGTQAFWHVDDFEDVRIAVSSETMLKQPRLDKVPGNRETETYSSNVLRSLPPANDYRVMVALASGSVIVGQGAVADISLLPGEVTPVSIYINSVGWDHFDSADYEVRGELPGVPGFFQGLIEGTPITLNVDFPWAGNTPEQDQVASVAVDIFDDETQAVVVASSSANAAVTWTPNEPEIPRLGLIDFTLPLLPGNEYWRLYRSRIYGLNSAGAVVTTKTADSPFFLLKGASITVDLQ